MADPNITRVSFEEIKELHDLNLAELDNGTYTLLITVVDGDVVMSVVMI